MELGRHSGAHLLYVSALYAMLYAGLYRKMNAITARDAPWLPVSAYLALAIVQPVKMSVSEIVQPR